MRFGTQTRGWKTLKSVTPVLGCALVAAVAASSQRGTTVVNPPVSASPNAAGNRPGYTDPNLFPSAGGLDLLRGDDQGMRMLRQNARRDEIKKHMEQNATRLLLLSAELRADLQTREPTEADARRLEEIAKLAHTVREQMKQ